MTNKVLDELTDSAARMVGVLPDLLMDGSGALFVSARSGGEGSERLMAVSADHVLRRVHEARSIAAKMLEALANEPRRKTGAAS